MTPTRMSDPQPPADAQSAFAPLRVILRSRIGLVSVAGAVIFAGLAFNWNWLVAAGVAPLLISVLPCAAMCALGLCMMQMKGRGAATGPAAGPSSTAILEPPPPSDRNDPLEAQVSCDDVTKVGVRTCDDA
jgi:hypothetical protein